jgi:hypothetical protein
MEFWLLLLEELRYSPDIKERKLMEANVSLPLYKPNFLLNRKLIISLKKEWFFLYEVSTLQRTNFVGDSVVNS